MSVIMPTPFSVHVVQTHTFRQDYHDDRVSPRQDGQRNGPDMVWLPWGTVIRKLHLWREREIERET